MRTISTRRFSGTLGGSACDPTWKMTTTGNCAGYATPRARNSRCGVLTFIFCRLSLSWSVRFDPWRVWMGPSLKVQCCIAGGGPAGMMLGYLLGRAGVSAVVLEKHADFLRDFRGDTVHPSTLMIMKELGLVEDFLKLPHSEIRALSAEIGDSRIKVADFSRISAPCKFVALMPQWDFLNF